jgi:hypothetical protein
VNGDRPFEIEAVAALLGERFGAAAGIIRRADVTGGRGFPSAQEESYWQVVDRVAPECLEVYSVLESCADLMGRSPDFGFGRFPRRDGTLLDLLKAELKATSPEQMEALYVAQITQLQEELGRQVDQNRRQDDEIAELKRQLEGPVRRIARALSGGASRLARRGASLIAIGPASRWLGGAGRRKALSEQAASIRASGLFDEKWYLEKYPDVARAKLDPVEHYLKFGVAEGRNPSERFHTRWYLDAYSDVSRAGINPLVHYIQFGRSEGRRPMKTSPVVTIKA